MAGRSIFQPVSEEIISNSSTKCVLNGKYCTAQNGHRWTWFQARFEGGSRRRVGTLDPGEMLSCARERPRTGLWISLRCVDLSPVMIVFVHCRSAVLVRKFGGSFAVPVAELERHVNIDCSISAIADVTFYRAASYSPTLCEHCHGPTQTYRLRREPSSAD